MKKIIIEWVKSKSPKIMLGHKSIESVMTYEFYNFMGHDGKYYSCNVVYDRERIIGSLSQMNMLRLGGRVEEGHLAKERPVFEILDDTLSVFDTKEEWLENRPKAITKEQFDEFISTYFSKMLESATGLEYEGFKVVEANAHEDMTVMVYYSLYDNLYSPLKYSMVEPSILRIRNHGEDSRNFKDFAEKIGSLFCGVIWY